MNIALYLFLKIDRNLVSINPYDIKLYHFLKLYHMDFTCHYSTDLSKAPNQRSPYCNIDGVLMDDSDAIIEYLVKQNNIQNEQSLTDSQKARYAEIYRLLNTHIIRAIYYSRLVDEQGWPQFEQAVLQAPDTINPEQLSTFREHFKAGVMHLSQEQIYEEAFAVFKVLEAYLENQEYLVSETVHAIDTTTQAFLSSIIDCQVDSDLKRSLSQRQKLVDYHLRVARVVT